MRSAACLLLALLLSGCPAGPDYVAPEIVAPEAFANADDELFVAAAAPTDSWASFDDPVLMALLDTALVNNTDLAASLSV